MLRWVSAPRTIGSLGWGEKLPGHVWRDSLRPGPLLDVTLLSMMVNKSRLPNDAGDELPRELIELGKRIAAIPESTQPELEVYYNQVVDSVRRRRRILALVQDALSQLRLDIKYLMFDLEVTRRERDALRERLEGGTPEENLE